MNFDLFDHTVLVTRAGSRAYGIQTESSDVDIKGIAIPPEEYILGLERFEQADKPGHFEEQRFLALLSADERDAIQRSRLEGTIYEIRKFMTLALDANPNILEVLFCRDSDVLLQREAARPLREQRGLFLSAKAKHTFSGYAIAQLKRIKTHKRWLLEPPTHKPTREEHALPAETLIPADQLAAAEALVQKKLDSWEIDLSKVPDESDRIAIMGRFRETMSEIVAGIRTDIEAQHARWRAAVKGVGIDDNLLAIMERERKYKTAKNEWDNYQSWQKSRNPTRAALEEKFGYDTKHGAHLVRLMRMCEEILVDGKVNVWRGDLDADELKSIRAGSWSYEKLIEFAADTDARLEALYRAGGYRIAKQPDRHAVGALATTVVRSALAVEK